MHQKREYNILMPVLLSHVAETNRLGAVPSSQLSRMRACDVPRGGWCMADTGQERVGVSGDGEGVDGRGAITVRDR